MTITMKTISDRTIEPKTNPTHKENAMILDTVTHPSAAAKSRQTSSAVTAGPHAVAAFAALFARFRAADLSLFLARLGLALVIFPHGAQKVLGWFGGWGFSATLNGFTQMMHIPKPLALAAIAAEFL